MTDFEKRVLDIKERYGDYLTQREFMEAARISSRTAYLATKSGLVPYHKEYVSSVRYYKIRAEDVAVYMERRYQRRCTDGNAEKESVIGTILSTEPEVLSIRLVSVITGMHKNSIARWIQKGYLKSFRWKGDYRIPKAELIRYIASPKYWIARSSSLQREAIRMTMEWLETQRTRFLEEGVEEDDNNKGSDR